MSVAAPATPRRSEAVPSELLGMSLFLFTELMLFCGVISAYIVLREQAGAWPPADQPRLPVLVTGLNTLVLLASAVAIWPSVPAALARDARRLRRALVATLALGCVFLVVQGAEWISLIGYGLTSSSSLYGALFYIVVGVHAVHVVAAVIALAFTLRAANRGAYADGQPRALHAMRLYWVFVVAIWPPLYALVYLW